MDPYRESSSGSLGSLLSGAILGAAGLAWWLFSEAERRQQTRLTIASDWFFRNCYYPN